MGLPRPAAFLDPSVDENVIFKNGINYASGGGGILNETSSLFIQRFSLYKQIELFQGTQVFMRKKIGKAAADKFFGEAFYVVAMGANDFINNYLLPVYSESCYRLAVLAFGEARVSNPSPLSRRRLLAVSSPSGSTPFSHAVVDRSCASSPVGLASTPGGRAFGRATTPEGCDACASSGHAVGRVDVPGGSCAIAVPLGCVTTVQSEGTASGRRAAAL